MTMLLQLRDQYNDSVGLINVHLNTNTFREDVDIKAIISNAWNAFFFGEGDANILDVSAEAFAKWFNDTKQSKLLVVYPLYIEDIIAG